MKKLILLSSVSFLLVCCNNKTADKTNPDKRIALRSDTLNVVKLTDTLVIFESTCRGCAYEGSTSFSITDSMEIIKLANVITIDNNSPDMNGGSVSKQLVLVPVKTGITNFKMYKFWERPETAADSTMFTSFKIEVKQ